MQGFWSLELDKMACDNTALPFLSRGESIMGREAFQKSIVTLLHLNNGIKYEQLGRESRDFCDVRWLD
ncbi:Stress responsive alpha-beta barrel [Macrophomina phaseolina MS6]|uniref:Stress responsive alpha-beta barrel n=1 Tax=Macrophomina phaseolina (strain MS6) TaxID=1126212 RepID=K2S266_MACPH|nr:Stress responsive alpha-beta barrel [Macrophomina phaseolina MS6]